MTVKSIVNEIKDELGSRQIFVDFRITEEGVKVISQNYADTLMAKHELNRRGIPILP